MTPHEELVWIAGRLERAYRKGTGVAKGLAEVLKGVTSVEAHWRPVTAQPTIAELVSDITHRYRGVARHLRTGQGLHPGEAPTQVPPTHEDWEELLRQLEEALAECVQGIRTADPALLDAPAPGSSDLWREVLVDLATDTSHHAAQILVLRRWYATQELAV